MVFIDLKKAYNRVPKEVLWKVPERKGVQIAYIRVIKDMHDKVTTSVRTQSGLIEDFAIIRTSLRVNSKASLECAY